MTCPFSHRVAFLHSLKSSLFCSQHPLGWALVSHVLAVTPVPTLTVGVVGLRPGGRGSPPAAWWWDRQEGPWGLTRVSTCVGTQGLIGTTSSCPPSAPEPQPGPPAHLVHRPSAPPPCAPPAGWCHVGFSENHTLTFLLAAVPLGKPTVKDGQQPLCPVGSCAERFQGEVGQPWSRMGLAVKESTESAVITGFDADRAGAGEGC